VTNYDNSLFDVYTRNKGNVSAGYIYVEVDFEMACGEGRPENCSYDIILKISSVTVLMLFIEIKNPGKLIFCFPGLIILCK